ncbi:hypothetical protein NQ117_12755 [Paenibacillus sp. SC116]|uniref:hypothetical protein n=1 Tax=Paenibacillus sp. SC116 TaxID=2968986 RepID=UPI00215AB05D|nr:hypothetical protein [Paenibacillus sp. SC116]MCR8844553.1 hypothetical protein [Paenibacillus sp. SC116]
MMHLWRFIQERYPLFITIPLCIIITVSLIPTTDTGKYHNHLLLTLLAVLTTWLGLLLLRAADDLHSIQADRDKSPQRGLVTGYIQSAALRRNCIFILVLLLFLHAQNWIGVVIICLLVGYYWLWFKLSSRSPIMLRPFGSNLIFAIIPFYIGAVHEVPWQIESLYFAGFLYFAVIAHEYAHNVQPSNGNEHERGRTSPPLNYTQFMGAKGTALLAGLLFASSFICGAIMAIILNEMSFLIALITHMLVNTYLIGMLIYHPTSRLARKFYVLGFTFFIIPLAVRIIVKALNKVNIHW